MLPGITPALVGGGGSDVFTKLLLHFNGNYIDSAKGRVFTNFGTTIVGNPAGTTLTANGMFMSAQGQRITCPNSTDFDFLAANWTIDFWRYNTSFNASAIVGHIAKRNTDAELAPFFIGQNTDGTMRFLGSFTGAAWDVNFSFGAPQPVSTWQHIAVVRNGAVITGYVNGVAGGSQNVGASSLWINNNVLSVGGDTTVSFIGYMEEVRISSVARWTANFTPPTAPYS